METVFLVLSVAAILVMLYALYSSFALKSKIPGGKVKRTWNILSGLIVMFTVGCEACETLLKRESTILTVTA